MNNSRVVFKRGWLLPLAVISIAIMALAFWAGTPNEAAAQGGGPGNGGRGGGSNDGAWEQCINTITGTTSSDVKTAAAINAALTRLNAREASGHHYTLVEVIACGIHVKRTGDSGEQLYRFRFIVDDDFRGNTRRYEKNVQVFH